jgi:hypothetical protein
MRKYFYSPDTKGFYLSDLHNVIPADKVEITEDQYKSLLGALNSGKTLSFANGKLTAVTPTITVTWDSIRTRRDALLAESDYTQLSDAPITAEKKAEWGTYRDALRNITTAFTTPDAVVWPSKPQ